MMAVDGGSVGVFPVLAIRSSVGIEVWSSEDSNLHYGYKNHLPKEETKSARSISFSPNGLYFAFSNGQEIKILKTSDWQLKCTLPRPKALYLKFSPLGNYLCTWELYTVTKNNPEGAPNMFVYELSSGVEVFATIQKKQTDWEPSWSTEESIFVIVVGGEALFYDLACGGINGFQSPTRKVGGSRNAMLSVAPGINPHLAFYTPGAKAAPSMCKLYKYPALSQNQVVACKSFFQADRVEMLWNKRGNGLLLLTSTEVDKSGASYYGNQALHFMATKGESCSVPLSKEGPVHCVKWSPKANEFVVVYGFMPSKASLYNLKCDVIFDFGEGPRNCAYFNTFGNLLVLAGFGNLPGNVEIWDLKKKEQLVCIKCPDTTFFEWSPNGIYFITATTAPRLRIGNNFKVYHYSGALIHETIWDQNQELLGVEWQTFPEGTFAEPLITNVRLEGIKSCLPEASKKVYTPPHLRLMKEGKNPEQFIPQPQVRIAGLPPGNLSKQLNSKKGNSKACKPSNKQKKRKEENVPVDIISTKDNCSLDKSASSNGNTDTSSTDMQRSAIRKQHKYPKQSMVTHELDLSLSGNETVNYEDNQQPLLQIKKTQNADKEKKIRNVAKKLSDIKKLKARQEQGETLELNQINKISLEAKFLEELKALKLSV